MIIEQWKQSQAYVIGKDHVAKNEVCQDRTYYMSENGVQVIALADGAGSRKRSEIGAELVTQTSCALFAKKFFDFYIKCEERGKEESVYKNEMKKLKKEILNTLLDALEQQAKKESISIDELSSTLLVCALYKNKYIICHIGDGAIGGLFEENDELVVKTLSEPKNGGAPNITFFVTDSDALDHFRVTAGELPYLRGIVLMSDGPAEVMYRKRTGFNDNVIKIFENFDRKHPDTYNRILHQFLAEKISHFSGDDLSLNLLYLESLNDAEDDYTNNLLGSVKSKDQIIRKSHYCIEVVPTLKAKTEDFSTPDDVRRYLQWR